MRKCPTALPLALVPIAVLIAACAPGNDDEIDAADVGPLVATPIEFPALDTLELFRAASLQPGDGVLILAEPGSGRVLSLDLGSRRITTFGREGRGPGELSNGRYAVAVGDVLWVCNVGNDRLTTFDMATGEHLADHPVPPGRTFLTSIAAGHDGSVLAPGSPGQPMIARLDGAEWVPHTSEHVPTRRSRSASTCCSQDRPDPC